jgi:hypothetical protein
MSSLTGRRSGTLSRQQVDYGTGFEEERSSQEKKAHRKPDVDISLFKFNTPNKRVCNVHGHSHLALG